MATMNTKNIALTSPIVTYFGARSTALDVIENISLRGRCAVVTGGASGLGFETSRALASAGADVIIAVRNLQQGQWAFDHLKTEYPLAKLRIAKLDLSDIQNTRNFAALLNAEGQPIDILINNAGIMACPLLRNDAGWESQFAVNHMGHFALTTALLPSLLKAADKTGDARVVCVSSSGHKIAGIDLNDIHYERRTYDKWNAYGQAKSANALFSLGLHSRYCAEGIIANAVDPGAIMTGLQKSLQLDEMRAMGWLKPDDKPIDLFKTTLQGAATSVWAATSILLKGRGGLYLENCRQAVLAEIGDRISGYAPHIMDACSAYLLWETSERMLHDALP
jgi:NAD(P)-dependent dehydrogenase (short-subunit alcohol dehydrogenase family)